jgi:hypothetical protein
MRAGDPVIGQPPRFIPATGDEENEYGLSELGDDAPSTLDQRASIQV